MVDGPCLLFLLDILLHGGASRCNKDDCLSKNSKTQNKVKQLQYLKGIIDKSRIMTKWIYDIFVINIKIDV
jgi:hypothetical protein